MAAAVAAEIEVEVERRLVVARRTGMPDGLLDALAPAAVTLGRGPAPALAAVVGAAAVAAAEPVWSCAASLPLLVSSAGAAADGGGAASAAPDSDALIA
jgi:hypothetical protein